MLSRFLREDNVYIKRIEVKHAPDISELSLESMNKFKDGFYIWEMAVWDYFDTRIILRVYIINNKFYIRITNLNSYGVGIHSYIDEKDKELSSYRYYSEELKSVTTSKYPSEFKTPEKFDDFLLKVAVSTFDYIYSKGCPKPEISNVVHSNNKKFKPGYKASYYQKEKIIYEKS